MSPFHSSSASRYQECPINDIESDNKSINQIVNSNLCNSFEGLLKKQEQECSTRNTEWSNTERQIASGSHIQNIEQNQKGQKVKCLTTIWNFNEAQQLEIKKIQKNKQIKTLKNQLVEARNQKMKKFRQLLPYFYRIQIPSSLRTILKMAEKIDKYLFEKKAAQYMDNVQNIFKIIFYEEQMSSIWSDVRKIMFLAEEYYKVKIDPLKNLCLGFGSKKDTKLHVRKQRLRKIVVDYYLAHKESFECSDIPEVYIEPTKIPRFYPEKCSNEQKNSNNVKTKPEYISSLKAKVNQKQMLIQTHLKSTKQATPINQLSEELPCPKQLKTFLGLISEIYSQKNVSSMYKVSLIQNLRKYSIFGFQKIFFLLKFILKQEVFLEVLMKSGCQILRIIEKQNDKLIQILEMKIQARFI